MLSEMPRKSLVNTAELRQIFPLRENTLRHIVEGDGRYPRAMTPSVVDLIGDITGATLDALTRVHASSNMAAARSGG